jgi:hypothetical protein
MGRVYTRSVNTSNLITDYIIAGALGLLCFVLPYLMIDGGPIRFVAENEIKNGTIIGIVIAIIGYAMGVICNQVVDSLENLIFAMFGIDVIKVSEAKLEAELTFNHHYALQVITVESATAYEYISFRRTMIRIVRCFAVISLLIPVFHVLYSLEYRLLGEDLVFSWTNLVLCLSFPGFSFLCCKGLVKLYRGYYAALTNFVKVIDKRKNA